MSDSMTGVRLADHPYVAIDLETTGLHWWRDTIFGVALALPDGRSYYEDTRSNPRVLQWLRDQVPQAHVINHHLKFDMHFLTQVGVKWPRKTSCTLIREALINEHQMTYDLDTLARKRCGIGKDTTIYAELYKLFGGRETKKGQIGNLSKAPIEVVAPYGKADALAALRLYEAQEPEIVNQGLERVESMEQRLMPVLLRMERHGVRVDVEGAEKAVVELSNKIDNWQRELDKKAGFEVNTNSPAQVARVFKPYKDGNVWRTESGDILESTDSGNPSFGKASLSGMKDPLAKTVENIRRYLKLRDTFLKGHILGHHHNGRVHTTFNQTKTDNDNGTGTGRLSCTDPALQQIHKRDKEAARIMRALFIPEENQSWVCYDWAQIDFRVFAHYAKNPQVLSAYAADPDTDFHQIVSKMTGLPRSPTSGFKGNAKQINLGLVFGMGEGKMCYEMGLPYTTESLYVGWDCQNCRDRICEDPAHLKTYLKPGEDGQALFERYHNAVPGVKDVLKEASRLAKARGYVKTISGRRLRFPGGMFTHKAGGLVFQGSAADCLKAKMIEVDEALNGTGTSLLLNVHDELDFSTDCDPTTIKLVQDIMQDFHSDKAPWVLRVPIRTDPQVGSNWYEASC